MKRQRPKMRRGRATRLTLIDIARWTLPVQHCLDAMLEVGRVDVDDLRRLIGLAELIAALCPDGVPPSLAVDQAEALARAVAAGDVVDEEKVELVQEWLRRCVDHLRSCDRADYQRAVGLMIERVDARDLVARLEQSQQPGASVDRISVGSKD